MVLCEQPDGWWVILGDDLSGSLDAAQTLHAADTALRVEGPLGAPATVCSVQVIKARGIRGWVTDEEIAVRITFGAEGIKVTRLGLSWVKGEIRRKVEALRTRDDHWAFTADREALYVYTLEMIQGGVEGAVEIAGEALSAAAIPAPLE